ncbi:SIS domain-containing protein [Peribacillus muralis]|uniref:SIS domain-containing protein n=1 Tax=Peribacillus muralis TaxID=264697 RepID=UPI001F4DADFE|nr:SIS domain-containing protein [Peribacillus muralis]MCK1992942.1 SIS domain-containing protein [Peribacillus muralis]MCK2013497.1 SIS domain-containing protein [Peribacillus muralis]
MITNSTYEEIIRQPLTWSETISIVLEKQEELKEKFDAVNPDEVIFIGCGTSYYISIAAALNFQEQTGISAKAVPASEVFLKPDAILNKDKKTLIIGSSRSGNTSEIVNAFNYVKEHDLATTIAITSYPECDLARISDYTFILPQVQEKSLVMTSTFTNILLASQLIAGIVSKDENYLQELKQLPERGADLLPQAEKLAKQLGEDLSYDHYIFLGLGSYYGLACEGMLKMKEMTQANSEAFNPLEFRHGPISVLSDKCRVVLLSNNSMKTYEEDLILDIKNFDANIIVLGEENELAADYTYEVGIGLSDGTRGLLYLPFLQLMAFYRTLQLGLHPDKPRNLNPVVILKQ